MSPQREGVGMPATKFREEPPQGGGATLIQKASKRGTSRTSLTRRVKIWEFLHLTKVKSSAQPQAPECFTGTK